MQVTEKLDEVMRKTDEDHQQQVEIDQACV